MPALIHLPFRHAQPPDMEGVSIGNTACANQKKVGFTDKPALPILLSGMVLLRPLSERRPPSDFPEQSPMASAP
ncbi:hypothetical protein SAMN05216576_104130 [Ectopseudomonas chengduensis]|uniref:Uncharacterized protein n=2 Tax=Pseudomonadaceae TaxID=135621 RepID=A0A1H2L501_9PSED|nr:hypothetical protein SAMN05216576_104130 [Pseudomonas chengduensis]SDU75628.1 hypothetical protein SAMN05216363_0077 [Pseudomonas sihuiensis]